MSNPQAMVEERLSQDKWGILGSQGYILGLDIGSYGLRAALIDLQKHTYASVHRETPSDQAEALVSGVIDLARELLDTHQVKMNHLVRVGVGFGGPVDVRRGVVLMSPRLSGWERFPLAERIETAFGADTLVDNDANLIALAEATFGVGRDVQNLFYLHMSSGVGGGLVINDRLYHGATTTAGEIGHALIGPIDKPDAGQVPVTLEQRVAIRGLLQRAGDLGLQTDSLNDIFSNNSVGQQVITETTDVLAARLSQIAALLDPEMIVLGGIVVRIGGDDFINAITKRMQDYMVWEVERSTPLVASMLGFDSVAIGGVALALESMRE
ncbi:MAG: ROK family protein [Chloroflexota bacterium]